MRCNPREVALSSALRDNSTYKLQGTSFLKLGSHYYREPTVPAGGCSTGNFMNIKNNKCNRLLNDLSPWLWLCAVVFLMIYF